MVTIFLFVCNNRIGIVLTCGKHLHDNINLIRGEVWHHKTSLAPPLCTDVSVPNHEHDW
jgi:hypothetical protein